MSTNSRARCAVVALLVIVLPTLAGCSSIVGSARFSLSGNAQPALSPGTSSAVNVEIRNDHEFAVTVRDVEVTVRSVRLAEIDGGGVCAKRDFVVQQLANDVVITVPAHASRTLKTLEVAEELWPHVVMVDSSVNQDACRDATVVLAYEANATRVTG